MSFSRDKNDKREYLTCRFYLLPFTDRQDIPRREAKRVLLVSYKQIRNMSKGENLEAEKFARWLSDNKYTFTHIGNESGLPPKVAMLSAIRKKRMGLSPGVPDYMVILKRGSILFIELKKQRTKKKDGEYKALSSDGITISPEQEKWIKTLGEIDNVDAVIAFGFEEAKNFVCKFEE